MSSYSLEQYDEDHARGEELWRGGRFAEALEDLSGTLARRLAALSAETSDPPALLQGDLELIERVADAAIITGRGEAADHLLLSYVGLARACGNPLAADYGTLKRIQLALEREQCSEAYALLREMGASVGDVEAIEFTPSGLRAWEAGRDWPITGALGRAFMLALIYFVMGRLLASFGQYKQALAALRRGLWHTRDGDHGLAAQARLRLKLAIGAAQLEAGELGAARGALDELQRESDAQQQPAFQTRLLEMSAKLHLLAGDFGAALKELVKARDLCHERGLIVGELWAGLNLSHLFIQLNHTNAARGMLTSIRELGDALGEKDVSAEALALLGLADERTRSASGGVAAVPSLFSIRRQPTRPVARDLSRDDDDDDPARTETGSYLALFELRVGELYRQLSRRDFTEAAAQLSDLKAVFSRSDSALVDLRLHMLGALIEYCRGRVEQAEACLRELRPAFREFNLTPELWQLQRVLGWCWARLKRQREEQHALADDTQRLLTLMADSLPAPHRAFFLLDKWTADEEYIAAQIDHLCHLRDGLRGGSWFRKPRRAWTMMQHLNTLLQHIDRYKDALVESTLEGREAKMKDAEGAGVPLWRRLLFHPPRRATVSFLVMPNRVLTTSAGWLFLKFDVRDTPRLAVREIVQGWHLLVRGEGAGRNLKLPDDFKTSGAAPAGLDTEGARRELVARLSDALGLPSLLRGLPRRIKALTIIPDDALHGFPFAAASYEDKHLIESYALAVSFKSDGAARAARAREQRPALLVGVSRGAGKLILPATEEELEVRPLPYAKEEVKRIREWFEGRGIRASALTNDDATKAAVVEGLAAADYVHIACHGFFAHERPDSSGLILAPTPGRVEVLSLRELAGLRLAGLRHISLSSCSSADNFIMPGRWIVSLPETLWRAGAQSILGCMWEIDDRFTASFMARFYWRLERHPRDEALKLTQLDCLRPACEDDGPRLETDGVNAADPINWAGYNLYGDHRRLRV